MHWSAWLLAALSGILQILIFPLPNLVVLCWIAFAPLLVALMNARVPQPPSAGTLDVTPPNRQSAIGNRKFASPLQAFCLSYLSALIWSFGTCYWIYHVMANYGNLAAPVAALVLVLFCLAWSVIMGFFGVLIAVAAGPLGLRARAIVLAPIFWVAAEWARQFSGFMWDPMGTVLVDNVPLSRIATVTGVWGLSFEIVLINTAFAVAFLVPRRRRIPMLFIALVAAGMMQAGSLVEPPPVAADGTARLVQPNIQILDPNVWTGDFFQKLLNDLSAQSIPAQGQLQPGEPVPELIVWPEAPAPFYTNDPVFHAAVSNVARQAHAWMIVGALAPERPGDPNSSLYNSAVLVNPEGQWVGRYDKINLVPFGEYVPFQYLLSFASKLTREVGDFIPGHETTVMTLPNYRLSVFICYESVFPNEIRQFLANGANLLVNISNDGWFGHTAAPLQHLDQARMRAIENNRWLLRSTNTGHTVAIDPFGRIRAEIRPDQFNSLDAPFSAISTVTFYTRHGDWFPHLCAIISLLIGALAFFRRKSSLGNRKS